MSITTYFIKSHKVYAGFKILTTVVGCPGCDAAEYSACLPMFHRHVLGRGEPDEANSKTRGIELRGARFTPQDSMHFTKFNSGLRICRNLRCEAINSSVQTAQSMIAEIIVHKFQRFSL
jgi:hypothetical protein